MENSRDREQSPIHFRSTSEQRRSVLGEESRFRPFPLDEYEARWDRVYAHMKADGFETAVVWGKTSGVYERAGDVLYLTNFFSTHSGQEPDTVLWNGRSYCAVILRAGETPELISDESEARYEAIATDRFQGLYDPIGGVADALEARGVSGAGGHGQHRLSAHEVLGAAEGPDFWHRMGARGRSRSRRAPHQESPRARFVQGGRRTGHPRHVQNV